MRCEHPLAVVLYRKSLPDWTRIRWKCLDCGERITTRQFWKRPDLSRVRRTGEQLIAWERDLKALEKYANDYADR